MNDSRMLEHLLAHLRRPVCTSKMSSRIARHVAVQVDLLLACESRAQILDLALVEEVQRRVEVLHVHDAGALLLRLGRRLLHLAPHLGERHLPLLRRRRARLDRRHRVEAEVDEPVAQVRELLLPEHREEIVLLRRRLAHALEDLEQRDDLLRLDPLQEGQLADAVLVEASTARLSDAVRLVEDGTPLPAELGLGDRRAPAPPSAARPGRTRARSAVDRLLVDRVVRQVELLRLRARLMFRSSSSTSCGGNGGSASGPLSAGDAGTEVGVGTLSRPALVMSLTCATSLSPRPLTQSSTASSFVQRPCCDAIQPPRAPSRAPG